MITSDTVLTHFDPQKPVREACDASPYGIGAVMSHVMDDGSERPVPFASRSLAPAEKNYAQIDQETLSLIWRVKRFNQNLYGKEFTLITDHQPLVSIFSPQKGIPLTAAARMQRWALFLGGHKYQSSSGHTSMLVQTDCHVCLCQQTPQQSHQRRMHHLMFLLFLRLKICLSQLR